MHRKVVTNIRIQKTRIRNYLKEARIFDNIIDPSRPFKILGSLSSSSTFRAEIKIAKKVVTLTIQDLKLNLHEGLACKQLLIMFIYSFYFSIPTFCYFLFFNCGLDNNSGMVVGINNSKIDESNF